MLTVMEDRERDLLEILRAGKSRKRLQKLFTNVGGGRTDKEAVELAIGRDPEWQHALLRVIQQIELVLTSKTVVEVSRACYHIPRQVCDLQRCDEGARARLESFR